MQSISKTFNKLKTNLLWTYLNELLVVLQKISVLKVLKQFKWFDNYKIYRMWKSTKWFGKTFIRSI